MENYKMEDLLRIMLECGFGDLQILDGCEIPFEEVVDHARELGDVIDLNTLTYAMFDLALGEVQDSIDNQLEEYEEDMEANPSDYEGKEYDELKELIDQQTGLDIREDVETFHNFIDTHAYLNNNDDLYRIHFTQSIDKFEELTGFELN
jgi:hypothetical protein